MQKNRREKITQPNVSVPIIFNAEPSPNIYADPIRVLLVFFRTKRTWIDSDAPQSLLSWDKPLKYTSQN